MKRLLGGFVRQSPAMVVAMLALFVALSGTAVATTSVLITGRQIKNNSITGLDVKNRSLRPIDFRGSLRGPRGLQGAKGDKGDSGATGSALLTGQATSLPIASGPGITQFRRAGVNGVGAAAVSVQEAASLVPGRNLVARNLTARVLADVPSNASVRIELLQSPPGTFGESVPSQLGCTIAGTDATTDLACTAPGPMTLTAGSTIFMRIIVAGGMSPNNPQRAFWGITVEPA
jgi:hypothetical protein